MTLLAQANVAIIHGGAGTTKECIFQGVPMVVHPLSRHRDHFGNAARVVHHRIGTTVVDDPGNWPSLAHMAVDVAGDNGIRARISGMQERFRQLESSTPSTSIIESLC